MADKAKAAVAKAKEGWKFRTEKRNSPDFGKDRKDWKAAQDAKKGKK